jgi:hypothetical protein
MVTTVTRAGSAAQKWFSESCKRDIVALGNHLTSVQRITIMAAVSIPVIKQVAKNKELLDNERQRRLLDLI